MKRICVSAAVALAIVFCAVSAMAWGSATHVYISERLNNKIPLLTLNQAYGGMAEDVFNFMSDPIHPEYQQWLSTAAHCTDGRKMWHLSILPTAKALSYGFISHNQAWGADHYAHNYSCPDNNPPTDGYIQNKAELLFPQVFPMVQSYIAPLGLSPKEQEALVMELLRDVIEYGVDILLIRRDPAIGAKVSASALLRSPEFPLLLNSTYALDFSRQFPSLSYINAAKIVSGAEMQFKQMMVGYGQILSQGEEVAITQFSAQMAELVKQLYSLEINPDLIKTVLEASMQACELDYMYAINATIFNVRFQMGLHGFYY